MLWPPGGQVSGAEPSSGAGGGESKKSDEPVCLPEGVNNPKIGSDIEDIKTELTNEVIRSFVKNFAAFFPTTEKEKVTDIYSGGKRYFGGKRQYQGTQILPWIGKVYEQTKIEIQTLVDSLVSKGVNYNKGVGDNLNANIEKFMNTKKIWVKSYKGYGSNENNDKAALRLSYLYPGATSYWTSKRIAENPPKFTSYYLASFYPYNGGMYPSASTHDNAEKIWGLLENDWKTFAESITQATTMEQLKTGERYRRRGKAPPLW